MGLEKFLDFIKEWIELFYIVEVIPAFDRGIKLRFGRYHSTLEPGWHWYWPFKIEQIITHAVVPDPQELREQTVDSKDGFSVTVTGIITYSVFDVKMLLLDVYDAKGALVDSSMGTIGTHLRQSTWEEIRSPEFTRKAEIEIRRRAKKYGVEVLELQFADMTRSRSLRIWNSSAPALK
jgi:regulator of protease activity HflC (stomatin/prohibitin superfamily)